MNESAVLAAVLVIGVLAEALRLVRPGQLLVARAWGRKSYRPAVLVFGSGSWELRAVGALPAGPALRFGGGDPAPGVPAGVGAVSAVRERVQELQDATGVLQAAGGILFVHLVAFTPAALVGGLVPYRWWVTGGLLLVIQAVVAVGFWRAHRRFHPLALGERVQHLVNILVFPPAGVFAADFVAGSLFEGVHPLCGALAVMDADVAASHAGALWRQWQHPVAGQTAIPSPPEQAACAEVLEACGVPVAGLDQPPRREGAASRAYCPRCLAQFTVTEGDCPDCPGVARRPFD